MKKFDEYINENLQELDPYDEEVWEEPVLTAEDIKKLKSLKISISPMDMGSRDDPNDRGMPLCVIRKDGKEIKTVFGSSHEEISIEVVRFLKNYLKELN